MKMTGRSRAAIVLTTAFVLGVSTYGRGFGFGPPGVLQYIWDVNQWTIYGLAVLGVFLVYRWWALLPAIAPAAVTVYLYNMTDHVPLWNQDPTGPTSFSDDPVLYVMFVAGGILLEAAVLSVGLLLRATWEWIRSGDRGSSTPESSSEQRAAG